MARRGVSHNPPNRFEQLHYEPLELPADEEGPAPRVTFFHDTTKSVLSRNDSPDLPFTFSINPYRGCEHGCVYCYARPSHEYLGFSAGLDFETKLLVKTTAPALLDHALSAARWVPQIVTMSGNTDCYQPVERHLRLTRGCLEVFLAHRNPVGIITKNALVTRDLDLLRELAAQDLVHVFISMITLDPALTQVMEPHTPMPTKRLATIRTLSDAGIPVGVSIAPVIPGLTDEEIPALLEQAAAHGAVTAGWSAVRLPGAVAPMFTAWLAQHLPHRADKVLHRIRSIRNGELDDASFAHRMRGEGIMATLINDVFTLHARRHNLLRPLPPLSITSFRRHVTPQLDLF